MNIKNKYSTLNSFLELKCLIMEEIKKSTAEADKEIVFSKTVKAGKRIYYLDVKKNRKNEMFLAITESKKVVMASGEDTQVNFEKHKIFLYQEDFEKFTHSLQEVMNYVTNEQSKPEHSAKPELEEEDNPEDINIEKIDIKF